MHNTSYWAIMMKVATT